MLVGGKGFSRNLYPTLKQEFRIMAHTDGQFWKYHLITAKILYHLPDHPDLLQEYIWQTLDILPEFPELRKFLDFWNKELDGKLHSVVVAHKSIIDPHETRFFDFEMTIH